MVMDEDDTTLKPSAEDRYEDEATYEPSRDIALPDQPRNGSEIQTLDDKVTDMSDLTDQQAFLVKLFPEGLGSDIDNAIMISRVSPDVFLPLLRMKVENEIMLSDPALPIDVISIIQKHYSLLSVGLDGKGRIDIAELSGAAREQKQMDQGMGNIG